MATHTFETQEIIKPAGTEYLNSRGITKVGHRQVFTLTETETGVQLCDGSVTRYYYADGRTEQLPSNGDCLELPKELLPQVKAELNKVEMWGDF